MTAKEKEGKQLRRQVIRGPAFPAGTPLEFSDFTPENFAFLQLLTDFRTPHVFAHALYLRNALYAAVECGNLFSLDETELIENLAAILETDVNNLRFALKYSVEYLWRSCDPDRMAEAFYIPAEGSFPDSANLKDCLKFLADAFAVEYEKFRYFKIFYQEGFP